MYNKLNNIDAEEIEDLLGRVAVSFDIGFVRDELVHITTFGQLCDHISNKIQLDNSNDCTSQQAFYKLREAIKSTLQIENKSISTNSLLANILPRKHRREMTKKLENNLGIELYILRPPFWLTVTISLLLLTSFVGLFFRPELGLFGIIFSIAVIGFSNKIGIELDLQTVGQLAEKMVRENYLKSRRNPKTFNIKEIENTLTNLFVYELGLDKGKLTRETKFVP